MPEGEEDGDLDGVTNGEVDGEDDGVAVGVVVAVAVVIGIGVAIFVGMGLLVHLRPGGIELARRFPTLTMRHLFTMQKLGQFGIGLSSRMGRQMLGHLRKATSALVMERISARANTMRLFSIKLRCRWFVVVEIDIVGSYGRVGEEMKMMTICWI